ncbi:MAG TPA: hypothetical protein IAC79_06320 [Candidatus Spyradenecus faecavium]|uniref:Uncharacterized protein n=1 Tax=Candidatus Spyradenecus faecavium TaxID=2840947 RepID=A0A9D1NN19_9BACT|nr:hypothetical protein [Candidatus Spyradenecus faecavium]
MVSGEKGREPQRRQRGRETPGLHQSLCAFAEDNAFSARLLIPADGETLTL